MPEHRAQALRKGEADLRVDLQLGDAGELVLDGIFNREDLHVRRVELGQTRVERRRLPGAGRAGDEDDPVRFLEQPGEDVKMVAAEAQLLEAEEHLG